MGARSDPHLAMEGRRFLCPACRRVAIQPIDDPVLVARCDACAWSTDDLLSLVPIRPAPLSEVVFGAGARGYLRAGLFLGMLGLAVALILWR